MRKSRRDLLIFSLVLKVFLASAELAFGLGLYFSPADTISNLISWLVGQKTPGSWIDKPIRWLIQALQGISIETRYFYALYVSFHGATKFVMIWAIQRGNVWAYPMSMALLSFFIFYQLFLYSMRHDIGALVISALDLLMMWLITRQYRRRRQSVSD